MIDLVGAVTPLEYLAAAMVVEVHPGTGVLVGDGIYPQCPAGIAPVFHEGDTVEVAPEKAAVAVA